jgi:hypothetical protein
MCECVCGGSQGGDWTHHQLDPDPSGGGSSGTTSPPSPYLSYFHASSFLQFEIAISETIGTVIDNFFVVQQLFC